MLFRINSPALIFGITCLVFAGCRPGELPEYDLDGRVKELTPELQTSLQTQLIEYTGTYLKPLMLQEEGGSEFDLKRGQAVYQERCVQCHGVSGDGNGPAAKYMYPRPRDYRKGLFKFTSTPYGSRPLKSDLIKTVRLGIRGTSMPAFNLLPEADQEAVVEYVIMLSRRGELEEQLYLTADSEEELDPEVVKEDLVPIVTGRWAEAEVSEVRPITMQPKFTDEHVTRGRAAFLTKGCSKCHGEDGRGQTAENRGDDAWGFPTRAADLTSGLLHGGPQPLDIYLRIHNGINGTPMPGFANSLKDEPDTIWDLVAYVLHVSSRRRAGESPDPGLIRPYPQKIVEATPAAESE